MASGVLTSNTVPVNWTIDRVDDSALRDSLYVQMQKAYKVTDELGYQQAASAMTTQLTGEVNALAKLFDGTAWTAALKKDGSGIDYEDAYAVSKSLMVSGAGLSEMPASTAMRFHRTVEYSVNSHGVGTAVTTPPLTVVGGTGSTPFLYFNVADVVNTLSFGVPGNSNKVFKLITSFAGDGGVRKDRYYYVTGSDRSTARVSEISPVLPSETTSFNGTTVPDTALPGDFLKGPDGAYYVVDVFRRASPIASPFFPIATAASAEQSTALGEKLDAAIGELTRNGQIEAARLQQLANLLQMLIGGASNTEARESRVMESILSKIG